MSCIIKIQNSNIKIKHEPSKIDTYFITENIFVNEHNNGGNNVCQYLKRIYIFGFVYFIQFGNNSILDTWRLFC